MAKIYIDSNIFFYAKIMDQKYGKSCSEIIRKIASREIEAFASSLVLVEVANAQRKYHPTKEIAKEIHAICSLGIDIYPIDSSDVQEAVEISVETNTSPNDCVHAGTSKEISHGRYHLGRQGV